MSRSFLNGLLGLMLLGLFFANNLLLAPRTLNIDSIYGDEGVYARNFESYLSGLSPYYDYASAYGPFEYLVMSHLAPSPTLLELRTAAVVLNFAACIVLYLIGIRLFGARSPWSYGPLLVQGIFGPQLGGNVPYVDFTCLPLLCAWIYCLLVGSRPDSRGTHFCFFLAGVCNLLLGFTKPQYGMGCTTAAWSLALAGRPKALRFGPFACLLLLLCSSHRHPGLLVACGAAWILMHLDEKSAPGRLPWRPYLGGMLAGALALLAAAHFQGLLLNVFYYPLSVVQSASAAQQLWLKEPQLLPRTLQTALLTVTVLCALIPFERRRSLLNCCFFAGLFLFAFSLLAPQLTTLLNTIRDRDISSFVMKSLACLISMTILVCVSALKNREAGFNTFCLCASSMVCLAACYDLTYIHARMLSVISLPLLFRVAKARKTLAIRSQQGLVGLTLGAGVLVANIPYYLDLKESLSQRQPVPTAYGWLNETKAQICVKSADFAKHQVLLERLGAHEMQREIADLPGLTFLQGHYTVFQIRNPGYSMVSGIYPDPRLDTPEFLVPTFLKHTNYMTQLQECRQLRGEVAGILIFGPKIPKPMKN